MKNLAAWIKAFVDAGMSDKAARVKGDLLKRNAERQAQFGPRGGEARHYFVPGRVEFLGKHTDYAGGRSLICPIEMGICVTAVAREDSRIRVVELAGGDEAEFAFAADSHGMGGHWANYPMTVARRLARNFGAQAPLKGADIVISADLPQASGMSSSSALMVGVYLALADVNGLADRAQYKREIHTREDLACYLGTVENGQSFGDLSGEAGVGTFGGSEDHTAMLCGQVGKLCQYSFCPTRFERAVPLPEGYVLAIGVSGVVARKTGAAKDAYNRASLLAREVFRVYKAASGAAAPSLGAALDNSEEVAERVRATLRAARGAAFSSEELLTRFEQFYRESCRVIPAAGDCLAAGDLPGLGRLVDESQAMTESLLGNQVRETVALASSARKLGAVAASAFGAGFGGSVWALVEGASAAKFLDEWKQAYLRQFPAHADAAAFLLTRSGPPVLSVG
ncbi:MAG: galactokinase [Planctomycetota bacterium]|nr:galactokinase [Planctomycetota bacterium]